MKLLKNLGLVMLVSFALSSCSAKATVRVAPAQGVVITKLHKPRVVVHKRVTYYCSKGVWYKKKANRYVVVRPPAGIKVTVLPRGYKVVSIRKKRYYTYNGIYYQKRGRSYVVVHV
ncbi:hypothetical protein GWK08_01050 [Leptobacterium flavescens]|uniref:Uncharacterized protein n=1 Tax=Leptobacterium flavescens TaxID=472055 RepID=A0A6P0UFK0_9FLAO|nr:DUF6515 family protein [Leptobacterium flavescens]NER12015.1 hypothetical protein [Leptobacterium flavescens]